jgi:hypothetical protein
MAQKVQVILVDDLDGGEAEETVSFSLDGVTYEIDLSQQNATRLRDELATWVGHARRISGRSSGARRPGGRGRSAGSSGDTASIREWAKQNGYKVSERGRIATEVVEAYRKANG